MLYLRDAKAVSYDTGIGFGVYVACASQMMNQNYREYKTLPVKVAFASLHPGVFFVCLKCLCIVTIAATIKIGIIKIVVIIAKCCVRIIT